MSILCVAWEVEGAERPCWGSLLMPGPLVLFLFLAGASLNPSRSMPVAVMAAQVCLMVLLVVVALGVVEWWLVLFVGGLGLLLHYVAIGGFALCWGSGSGSFAVVIVVVGVWGCCYYRCCYCCCCYYCCCCSSLLGGGFPSL